MWFMAAFPARISALQEMESVWKASEAVLFSKYSKSLMKSNLPSYSLKTCQTLGPKEQNEFVKNWPKEGMIVDGVVYPLMMWERPIKEKDGSCLHTMEFPTLTARDARYGNHPSEWKRHTPSLCTIVGGKLHPHFAEWMMGYNIDHTELDPWVIQWFQNKQKKRSKF